MPDISLKIALVGCPNSGKSTLFNRLSGLQQKVGNYPGVTVEKHEATIKISEKNVSIIDLPGINSLHPRTIDERITYDVLMQKNNEVSPNAIIIVADATNLKRQLLLCTQLIDLQLPTLLVLTMIDSLRQQGSFFNIEKLSLQLGVKILPINAKTGEGISQLKILLAQPIAPPIKTFFENPNDKLLAEIQSITNDDALYFNYLSLSQSKYNTHIPAFQRIEISEKVITQKPAIATWQANDITARYKKIDKVITETLTKKVDIQKIQSHKIDNFLLHPIFGILFLLFILLMGFQLLFTISVWPQNAIESGMNALTQLVASILPKAWWSSMITDGLLAGISGVIIFIPQIALLFGFISFLEESGYMSRISFISNRTMEYFGMNGKSVIPLLGGAACAVPAIMACRTIENPQQRLFTLLVIPLMSCSARIPVYTLLTSLLVPRDAYIGSISVQALVMLGFYMFGLIMALLVSLLLSMFIKSKTQALFFLEMPVYRMPLIKNIALQVLNKTSLFVKDAGKIIIFISILLWASVSYSPTPNEVTEENKLEKSYAGYFGKYIEPAIIPLGFDWKIGISIITSFAAREVFVGSMATIYQQQPDAPIANLSDRMQQVKRPDGSPVYTTATTLSLLFFFAIAMQCMSTFAITYSETKSLKVALGQFFALGLLAYFFSFIIYQLFK